jgi:U3 small nucleolar RNA-associated protein 15
MSKPYTPVALKRFPAKRDRVTAEGRYWKRFRNPISHKQNGPVSCIHFSKADPYNFAVTSSSRVLIYSPQSNDCRHAISSFKDIAYSAQFRHDGKLLAAGGEFPKIRVFEAFSRAVLREYSGHRRAVHVVRWAMDGLSLFSGSDDQMIRHWDLATEQSISAHAGHTDYIRAGAASPISHQTFCTGSYDHTVKVWDMRNGSSGSDGKSKSSACAMTFDHGDPVEATIMLPGGSVMLSAGANTVKAWDLLGGKLMHTFSNHQKTVTSLCMNSTGSRILSASLDGLVKIYDVSTYEVVHGLKYNTPVLSVAMSPNDSHLVAGTSDGVLSIRQRDLQSAAAAAGAPGGDLFVTGSSQPRGGSSRYFNRGRNFAAPVDSFKVEVQKRKQLKAYDQALKKFKYKDALDAALQVSSLVQLR